MASRKETLKSYSMELPPTFPRPPAPGHTFHYLSPQSSQPGCWSKSSTNPDCEDNGNLITATERAALNEAMRKLVSYPSFHKLVLSKSSEQIIPKMPVLSSDLRASKLREIFQTKTWTIYQLASLQSHLEAHLSITVEEIGPEEIGLEEIGLGEFGLEEFGLEEIGLEETADFHEDSGDNTGDDINTAMEAFIAAVSRIVVSEQTPLDS
jgi:hypothetical protein